MKISLRLLPLAGIALFLAVWQVGVTLAATRLVPGPWAVALALGELTERGLLFRYVVASLFRVTWGYLLAALVAIPAGMAIGLMPRVEAALNPLLQVLRPISPLAWIPVAILWFGVGDGGAVWLIFVASFFAILVAVVQGVHNVDAVHYDAGRNFGLGGVRLVVKVLLPAILPQLIVGLRIALGIAWIVVVAAEMIAVSSGLGFLIIDARNAGNRYDLVVAGMVMIAIVGLALDRLMQRLERLPSVRWGFAAP
jgi:NitT/TauT family transport system permease protein